jgi:hypothetical protein
MLHNTVLRRVLYLGERKQQETGKIYGEEIYNYRPYSAYIQGDSKSLCTYKETTNKFIRNVFHTELTRVFVNN